MSRRRYLTSDISTDPRIADLSSYGALPVALYLMAITHADDWGRLTGDARQFKLLVCPGFDVTARDIDEALGQIAEVGLWLRYSVEGRAYIAFPPASWFRYQTYIGRDKRATDGSAIPAPADPAWRALPAEPAEPVAPTVTQEQAASQAADNAAERRGTPQNAEDRRATPNFAAECRGTPLHARTPSPSPSPSLAPTAASAGRGLSPERDNAREPAQADVAPVAAALAASLAADAALSLVAHTPSSSASIASPTSAAVSETPANVTPLPIAGRAASRRSAAAVPSPAVRAAVRTGGVRVPDPVWDACIAAMGLNGAAPSNRVERGKWARGIQALKESLAADGSPPSEIGIRSARYRARYGAAVPLNPMALAGNWTVLAHDIPREEQRHGNVRYAQAGRRNGRSGGPAVGTPEYYAQAAAQPYYTGYVTGHATSGSSDDVSDDVSHTGGGAGQGVREAAQEWIHAAAE
jgi:hypothetical protein